MKRPEEEQKFLYRYFPAIEHNQLNTERIFVHNQIRFTCPLNFNDPFDCRAYVLISKNPQDEESIKRVESKMESLLKNVVILCLSEINDNILMWSHYSSGHKGLCLEFDATEKLASPFALAKKVIYPEENELPKVDIYETDENIVRSMLLNKSKAWKYEEEWRIIKNKSEEVFYPFPETCLRGVIFGCQMPNEDKEQIKKWVKEGQCSPELYQAIKKENEFGLDILPIDE
jgi:hypothetical protein